MQVLRVLTIYPRRARVTHTAKKLSFRKCRKWWIWAASKFYCRAALIRKLKIDYYEDLFSSITEKFPQVWIHGLSVAEILYIAKISRLSTEQCLVRLRDAGLKTIPGAGAEMLVDRVRKIIAPYKDTTGEWLDTMKLWHRLGGHSTVTMMYGTVETPAERLEHLLATRAAQDESLATTDGGFTAFIAWNFQPDGTPLGDEIRAADPNWRKASGYDYLRTIAVGRFDARQTFRIIRRVG